jgi:transposase InsO family protein
MEQECSGPLSKIQSFEQIPQPMEIPANTLESLGPRDFLGDNIKKGVTQFSVTFKSKGGDEVVKCKDLHPKLESDVRKGEIEEKTIEIDLGESLEPAQRKEILTLCAKYVEIFVRPPGPWKPSNATPHTIETGDVAPVRQPYRRIPFHKREAVEKETAEMLKNHVIQESRSGWQSPILLVKKPDGSIRFVIDFRGLNQVSKWSGGRIPLIADTLDALHDAEFYSSLDLASGYWQLAMAEKDREKTAFLTHEGLFEFRVLPFGLKSAPFSFQRAMDKVLAGIQPKLCHVYLDDIITHASSWGKHMDGLEKVFQRISEAGMFCQPKKCHFGKRELKYLGFLISKSGIKMDPAKIEAVKNIATPKNKTSLLTFLGMTGHYRRFVRQYADVAAPLHELTKDVPFVWEEKQTKAFETLKERLITAPILRFPDFKKEFVLQTDASDFSLGAVLAQGDEQGREQVVAYISHKLTDAERKWTVREKEAFAVVWACDQLRYYLIGKHFKIKTDHKNIASVKWVLNYTKHDRLGRWALLLQEFHFTIEAIKGKENSVADALSRLETINLVKESWGLPDIEDLRQFQNSDPLMGRVVAKLQGKSEDSDDVKEVFAYGGKFYLSEKNGLLMYTDKVHPACIVVPPKLRYKVFAHFHELVAHAAQKKTYKLMIQQFFWRGMAVDVRDMVRECWSCQKNKTKPPVVHGELQLFPADRPWKMVSLDIFGPLPETVKGNKYVLVICDRFSRWVVLVAMPDMSATTVADAFVEEIIYVFGCPSKVLSDRGSQFTSKMFRRLMARLGVDKIFTTAYHPATNGQPERMNRFIAAALRAYTEQFSHSDWDHFLQAVAWAYRISWIDAVKNSPYFLLFARQPTLPTNILYGDNSEFELDEKFQLKHPRMMRLAHEAACEAQGKFDIRKKEYYDRKHVLVKFEIGDLVWLYSPRTKTGLSKKLASHNLGPFKILKKDSPVNYTIGELDGSKIGRIHSRVHIQRLIPFRKSTSGPMKNDAGVERKFLEEGKTQDRILKQRLGNRSGGYEYLVKSGVCENWILKEAVSVELIKEFNGRQREERAVRRECRQC